MTDEGADGEDVADGYDGDEGDDGDASVDGSLSHRAPARVRDVYDDIAAHFAKTREYPWPEVEAFVADAASGRVGFDVGCANGRHTELLVEPCETVIGLDVSRALLDEASERLGEQPPATVEFLQGDAAALPIAESSVDTALYVATIHHLPDPETRRESLRELAHVLDPDGIGLVSAWCTAHDRFEEASADDTTGFDTTIDWTLPGGETVPRFYHIYAQPEFEADLRAGGLAIESSVISSGNCYARVRPE